VRAERPADQSQGGLSRRYGAREDRQPGLCLLPGLLPALLRQDVVRARLGAFGEQGSDVDRAEAPVEHEGLAAERGEDPLARPEDALLGPRRRPFGEERARAPLMHHHRQPQEGMPLGRQQDRFHGVAASALQEERDFAMRALAGLEEALDTDRVDRERARHRVMAEAVRLLVEELLRDAQPLIRERERRLRVESRIREVGEPLPAPAELVSRFEIGFRPRRLRCDDLVGRFVAPPRDLGLGQLLEIADLHQRAREGQAIGCAPALPLPLELLHAQARRARASLVARPQPHVAEDLPEARLDAPQRVLVDAGPDAAHGSDRLLQQAHLIARGP
jgi:hypothetical protein